jgi:hypothetical protein
VQTHVKLQNAHVAELQEMFLSFPCLGGRQVHFNKVTRRAKARRRARLERVTKVEDFLRPYKLKCWNATRWEVTRLENLRLSQMASNNAQALLTERE